MDTFYPPYDDDRDYHVSCLLCTLQSLLHQCGCTHVALEGQLGSPTLTWLRILQMWRLYPSLLDRHRTDRPRPIELGRKGVRWSFAVV